LFLLGVFLIFGAGCWFFFWGEPLDKFLADVLKLFAVAEVFGVIATLGNIVKSCPICKTTNVQKDAPTAVRLLGLRARGLARNRRILAAGRLGEALHRLLARRFCGQHSVPTDRDPSGAPADVAILDEVRPDTRRLYADTEALQLAVAPLYVSGRVRSNGLDKTFRQARR